MAIVATIVINKGIQPFPWGSSTARSPADLAHAFSLAAASKTGQTKNRLGAARSGDGSNWPCSEASCHSSG
jgi:hypothetical protein